MNECNILWWKLCKWIFHWFSIFIIFSCGSFIHVVRVVKWNGKSRVRTCVCIISDDVRQQETISTGDDSGESNQHIFFESLSKHASGGWKCKPAHALHVVWLQFTSRVLLGIQISTQQKNRNLYFPQMTFLDSCLLHTAVMNFSRLVFTSPLYLKKNKNKSCKRGKRNGWFVLKFSCNLFRSSWISNDNWNEIVEKVFLLGWVFILPFVSEVFPFFRCFRSIL